MKKPALTKLKKELVSMLSESTGTAMCDSGGYYGRHWQRNAGKTVKDWDKMPQVDYDERYGYYKINVYHYLLNGIELDPICDAFNRINRKAKDWEATGDYHGVSKKAEEFLKEYEFKIERGFNSYNGESALSQVIQGTWVKLEDREYLILQIHQGADVRGGYTNARLFYVPGYEDGALLEDVYGSVTRKDGSSVNIDNRYDGHNLTDEDGNAVEIGKEDKVELELMGR